MDQFPLVGSISSGFGSAQVSAPTERTPNIEEASKDFVGMLYAYMFQQMRESGSDEEEGLFSGAHTNMLMGILDQEVGKKMAHTEGQGLADALLTQMGGKAQQNIIRPGSEPATFAPVNVSESTQLPEESLENLDPAQQIMDELYKLNAQG